MFRCPRLVGDREVNWLLAAGFKGLKNWIWVAIIGAVVAALWVAVAIADRRHENTLEVAAQGGAASANAKGFTQTLDQLGDANHAEQNLRELGERSAQRHADCLRDARDPSTCERYRPLP